MDLAMVGGFFNLALELTMVGCNSPRSMKLQFKSAWERKQQRPEVSVDSSDSKELLTIIEKSCNIFFG